MGERILSRLASFTEARRTTWRNFARQVLVEGATLTMNGWARHFRRLRKDITTFRSVLTIVSDPTADGPDPRELLIWAWCVLIAMPGERAQFYQQIPEEGEGSLKELARELREREYDIEGLPTAMTKQVRWLGALIRAIEGDLNGHDWLPNGTAGWKPTDWIPHDYPCYVIPVLRPYRAENKKDRARRATLDYAIVPRQVGNLEVELLLLPDVNSDANGTRSWIYGAPIFDRLTIDIERRGTSHFVVTDTPCPDDSGTIERQVACALSKGCDALVWPELTMPERRLDMLLRELRKGGLRDKRRIPITVAGSSHLNVAGDIANRCEIIAGKGQRLGSYDKRRVFEWEGMFEDILPGEKLLVLVTEDRLIAVAICKDFCDDVDDGIYNRLLVDLVLVPSMGRLSTFRAHKRKAKSLQSKQGSVSCIVQQINVATGSEPPDSEPLGYSCAEPASPIEADKQDVEFRTVQGRR